MLSIRESSNSSRNDDHEMSALRWLAVPLSVVAVWWALLLLGIFSVGVLDALCPADLMISGMCTAPWHPPAFDALVVVYAALVSAGVVLVPAWLAPAHRFAVALSAYLLGACFAIYVAVGGSMWLPFVAAAASGSAALGFAASRWRGGGRVTG
jgi:hypothetical protein